MGILTMVKNIKQIHEKDIVLFKIGKFYYCYGKDAYIISYFFEITSLDSSINGNILFILLINLCYNN